METTNKITIYHNNSCSKSRAALNVLKQNGEPFELIEYLKEVPSVKELSDIIAKLKCAPHDLIRTTEPIYVEKFKGKSLSDMEWIAAMHENPILIQRPIMLRGNHAVVARDVAAVQEVINTI